MTADSQLLRGCARCGFTRVAADDTICRLGFEVVPLPRLAHSMVMVHVVPEQNES